MTFTSILPFDWRCFRYFAAPCRVGRSTSAKTSINSILPHPIGLGGARWGSNVCGVRQKSFATPCELGCGNKRENTNELNLAQPCKVRRGNAWLPHCHTCLTPFRGGAGGAGHLGKCWKYQPPPCEIRSINSVREWAADFGSGISLRPHPMVDCQATSPIWRSVCNG
jgi:hypothetical protein